LTLRWRGFASRRRNEQSPDEKHVNSFLARMPGKKDCRGGAMRRVFGLALMGVLFSGLLGFAQQPPIDWGKYIDHIVDLLEEHSVFRYEIDWTVFRARVDAIMKPYNLNSEPERSEVLRQVFVLLSNHCDVHSSYCPLGTLEEERAAWADGRIPHAPGEGLANPYGIDARMLDGGIGYIAIPRTFPDPIIGVSEASFAMGLELLRLVRLLDAEQPAGWIIDPRRPRRLLEDPMDRASPVSRRGTPLRECSSRTRRHSTIHELDVVPGRSVHGGAGWRRRNSIRVDCDGPRFGSIRPR